MNLMPVIRRRSLCLMPAIVSLLVAVASRAQEPAPTPTTPPPLENLAPAPATMLQGGLVGELLSIYPPRDVEEVKRLLEYSRSLKESAEREVAQNRSFAGVADGRFRIMEGEVQTTKTRLDVAKSTKNDAERARLERDLKRQESEKKYLERLRDVLRADADRLESEIRSADSRLKALELEVDVQNLQSGLAVANPVTESDIATYREHLQKMLKAQKASAEDFKNASEKRKQVADRRLKQLEALARLNVPSQVVPPQPRAERQN